mgnify:CR=1 FL=1
MLPEQGMLRVGQDQGRRSICFDFDWRFFLEGDGESIQAEEPGFDDRGWEVIQTPHDYSILQPFDRDAPAGSTGGYLPGGVGWYRKRFSVAPDVRDRRVYIEFDGVYRNSDVWCNSAHLGHRHYGYATFRYELTDHLKPGEANLIAVRADNSDQPNCRWYSGSGIYRHVRLVITERLAIEPWGVYVTTENALAETPTVRVRTTVANAWSDDVVARLETTILDPDGKQVAATSSELTVPAAGEARADQRLALGKTKLWSPGSPELYRAVCSVIAPDGSTVDSVQTRFGIRQIEFDPDRGFLLNGELTTLKGGNIHHDGGCVGAAVPKTVWRRRLETIKAMGANTVRMSHNPPAPEVLDLCDELGLFVLDEAFDKWNAHAEWVPWLQRTHATFEQDWRRDLDAMLLRDRNHPSVIIWSVGNEVVEYPEPEKCLPTYRRLAERVRAVDPTRPVTLALQYVENREEALHESGLARELDIISLNYQESFYGSDRQRQPDRLILGTETRPFFNVTRESRKTHYIPDRNPWLDVVENDHVIGGLVWTIVDYLGEAGWPRNGWCVGLMDTCGWPKPRSNFLRCAWSVTPEVRIQVRDDSLPIARGKLSWDAPRAACHWNWPDKAGDIVHVETPTNCETVELLLNGTTCGVREAADSSNHTVEWYVPYEKGVLEAVGRNAGDELARWKLETTGPAVALRVTPDRRVVSGDGHDVVHLEIRVVDKEGRRVPDHDAHVNVNVRGQGNFLGMDNGDQVSKQPYFVPRRKTHFGRCLAVVRARRGTGRISVRVTSEELDAAECGVRVD